ncbi:MAG: HNH endonuclease [Verrucomicrobiales bacterium]|nr:HNH endonuclease [Verrucomicrobiales bacterium]
MNFWWVNHKQTFRQEFFGKYIWSPKRKQNGQINPFYETMREVAPGDIIYSFADAKIQGFGVARTHGYTSPRPDEFGHIGQAWHEVGWRVDVDFQKLTDPIQPTQHMQAIAPTLPEKYSPIRANGFGNQGVYLAQIPRAMALVIAQLASPELLGIIQGIQFSETVETPLPELRGIVEWEEQVCALISEDQQLRDTEKQALIKARRGQGLFRHKVGQLERFCRVTRVDRPEHLIASHIKPWRESDNRERLFEGNGLLLTPTIDHLFDRGFISFENTGELLVSPIAHTESMNKMGIITDQVVNVGGFAEPQRGFLEFHRSSVFLKRELR